MFPHARLNAMCAAIRHRGPDDEHTHVERGVALGARRLSIVDLAGGRQPLSNETETIWAAFNGELFEYPELFVRLKQRGHQFATRCDTELWVHLYEEYGLQLFEQVKGQFAVSLWDRPARRLVLARDRVGIAPLYYTECDGWLLWASEVKGILASGIVEAKPDVRNLDHFFACLYSSSVSRSFFEGVHCLPPGTMLTAQNGRIELRPYWQLEFPDSGTELRVADPEELVDEFEHLLRQAVRRRLRGDVPVVSYLSGGVDSTVVTALACQESATPLPTYTIGLLDTGKNECAEAEQSARLLGAPFTKVEMSRYDLADALPELVRAAEAPLIDITSACMIRLAQRVRDDGFKVALSGEGADEAMAGYAAWGGHIGKGAWAWRMTRSLLDRLVPPLAYRTADGQLESVPRRGLGGARPPQQLFYEYLSRSRLPLYSALMQRSLWGANPLDELHPMPARFSQWDSVNQGLFLDYRIFLHGHLLSTKGDRPTMNASIEARPPFLDEDVVAFCARISPEYKLRGNVRKWLLRQVASRWLPPQISQRKKHGFKASSADIYFGPAHPPWVDQLLSEDSIQHAGLFNPVRVAKRIAQVRAARKWGLTHSSAEIDLMAVIATQLWFHTFCGGGLADLPMWQPPRISEARRQSLSILAESEA